MDLVDADTVSPSFIAPGQNAVLVFELEVSDGADSSVSTVTVNVTGGSGSGRPGDINGDDTVNAIDVQKCINQALSLPLSPGDKVADLNGDDTVNAIDVQRVINYALGIG